ncbi:hypothetical protein L21SP3_00493 [Sedimentisphaera cyanobacteriorum]|uniref:TIGR02757 family protein n=1 Tax=Sedimentisphaera cyanobacteriorum TaxID=1940790 RepID=A0A1Q2HN85_9BACT|nr:TIGR02757 family protein [Sedimentisphaera cyanobacteriorum]AQQ08704.1 hypothetical protein L21SP3_00493 [Sedimentisphaera cyanobacteriorum]
MNNTEKLKEILEGLYQKYNTAEFISSDPVMFVHRYSEREDMEIAAFIASSLAYGRVAQVKKSVDDLLSRMGKSPREFIDSFDRNQAAKLSGFKHRFNTGKDFVMLFNAFKELLDEFGSLENAFNRCTEKNDPDVIPALTKFTHLLKERAGGHKTRGLGYLLANPGSNSPCKRLNMFLRWTVRNDSVDPGPWEKIGAEKLIIPLDTHLIRLCRIIGLHKSKNPTMQTAKEVTEKFALICPEDPVKYDFALSRIGIVENCNGRGCVYCGTCELRGFCG